MAPARGKREMPLDILSIGSISIDTIQSQLFFGGTAANVAVNGARLGLATGLYSAASRSEWGKRYRDFLQVEGVRFRHPPDYLARLPEYHASLNSDGTTKAMEFHDNGLTQLFRSVPQDEVDLPQAEIIHFAACEPSFIQKVMKTAPPEQLFSYNPGGWLTYDVDYFSTAYPQAHFLYLNAAEYQRLVEAHLIQDPLDLCARDDQVIVITRGSRPIWVVKEGRLAEMRVEQISAVDETGAGDGFISAFLWAWIGERPLETCLQLALAFAALIAQQYGAQASPEAVRRFKTLAAGL